MLAGTHNGGLFRSTDNGASWTAVNQGIQSWPQNYPQVYSTFKDIEFAGSSTALAGNFEGMYRSTNNGGNWSYQSDVILATDVREVAAHENVAYAATYWSGMFVSEDNGSTWIRRNNGLAAPHLLAAETQDEWAFTAVENFGVYRSNDKGMTWTAANNGILGRVESLESDNESILAVTAASRYVQRRIWRSVDHGASWTEVNSSAIPAVTAVEVRGDNIYAGGFNGNVSWTNNGGNSWMDITGYIPTAEVSAILSLSDDEVYVSTRGKGVWKITNYGHNVVSASAGLTNLNVTDLEFRNDILFASTHGSGIFASQNRGASWFAVNGGLDNPFVENLGGVGTQVYAGTGTGVFNSTSQMYDNIAVLAGIREHQTSGISVAPNPARGEIFVNGLKSREARIRIFDVTGKVVLEEAVETSASHHINLDVLKRGVYILQCTGELDNYTGRIIVQ
jgi:hypothetical protein